jgi:hypothetical protein
VPGITPLVQQWMKDWKQEKFEPITYNYEKV